MKEAFRNWAFALLLVLIVASIWKASTLLPEPLPTTSYSQTTSATPTISDITGCYVNFNDRNKYTLEIEKLNGNQFSAFVAYYNDGFDSSSGKYIGSFTNNILDGIYSFASEGSKSKRELVFKYVDGHFIAGFGDYQMVDGVELLTSLQSVNWFEKYTYLPASDCSPPK